MSDQTRDATEYCEDAISLTEDKGDEVSPRINTRNASVFAHKKRILISLEDRALVETASYRDADRENTSLNTES